MLGTKALDFTYSLTYLEALDGLLTISYAVTYLLEALLRPEIQMSEHNRTAVYYSHKHQRSNEGAKESRTHRRNPANSEYLKIQLYYLTYYRSLLLFLVGPVTGFAQNP